MQFRVPMRLLSSLLLVLGTLPAAAFSGVPDWVRDAAKQPLPKYPESTKAVVLLSDITYTVAPDGRATERVRRVIKILRPQGRDLAYPVVWFDKDSKINFFRVWSIDPAGHEFNLKDSDMMEVSPPGEGGELYSDDKAKVANPPGRDPGGIIACEYEKRVRPYLAETSWRFQDDTPRVKQSFTLNLPAGFTYTTTWAHHLKIDPTIVDDKHSYHWEMNDEAAIDLDEVPLSPAENSLAARMTIHYAGEGLKQPQEGSWKGIGEWYDSLSRDRLAPSPEIAAKAAELTAGKTDFFEKSEAIAIFLQQHIRYFVIEMGIGGYQPHPAAEIFRGRYGDCKDKATLLSAMLSSVGIHSALLMVDTERGVIDPENPSITGNHMIGAIEIPVGYNSPKLRSVVTAKTGKRYLIFDPTWTKTAFGQLEKNLQGSYGILMEASQSEVIQLPVMPPELNTLHRSATFHLSASGTLKGTVTDKRFGDVSEERREVATEGDRKQQQQYMDRVIARDFGSVSLTGLKFADAETLSKDIVTTFDLEAEHFASATGPLLMIRPRVFGSYQVHVDRKPRKVAIDLSETLQGHDDFDIELPPGYVVDELPEPVKLDVGFASYESRTEVHGTSLHYSRTYTLREITLPASKYRDLQHLASVIGGDEESRVILKREAKDVKVSAIPAITSTSSTP